ncbi:hypothetical protein PFLmoz3_02775 [Pseudomonas fluorescens]|uniref:Uncharacterized protein n=1 Tax=Pseudomonas fluorescens TaxID=294 RepID=A0A125QIF3_PSEFL|nr:hypothetical protein PFLmoz3_02775 [Pseudomonas fluorescens]
MGIQVLHLRRLDARLAQRLSHCPARTVTVFRPCGHVIGVCTGAIAHQFGNRLRAPRQGMFEFFNYQNAGAFAHHKAVARLIEGSRSALRGGIEIAGQRSRCGESGKADAMNRRFGTAAYRDVDFPGANHSRCVADSLNPGGTRGYWRTQRAFQAIVDRHMPGGHVAQKRWNGEGRQTTRALAVGGAHRIGNGRETADAGGDDGCRAFLLLGCSGGPIGLLQGFIRRRQGKQDKAVHLALFLGCQQSIRIKTGFGVLQHTLHLAADADRQITDQLLRQAADARLSVQQALPSGFHARPQRRQRAHARHDDTFTHAQSTPVA